MTDLDTYDFDAQGKGYGQAMDDFPEFDYRLTDEFDDEPQEFQDGYRKGWSQAVHEDVNSRYPGYDNPNSMPPAWFDPADAGEVW